MDPNHAPRSSWHSHLMDVYDSMKASNPGTTLKQAMDAARSPWLAAKNRIVEARRTVVRNVRTMKKPKLPGGQSKTAYTQKLKDANASDILSMMKQQ